MARDERDGRSRMAAYIAPGWLEVVNCHWRDETGQVVLEGSTQAKEGQPSKLQLSCDKIKEVFSACAKRTTWSIGIRAETNTV